MIVSAAWSLTVGGVSGRVESLACCLGTASIDDETGAKIGVDTVDASVATNTKVGTWLTPTTEALGGKMLESSELLNNNNQRNVQLLTLFCYQSLNPCQSTMERARASSEEEKITSL